MDGLARAKPRSKENRCVAQLVSAVLLEKLLKEIVEGMDLRDVSEVTLRGFGD